MLAKNELQMRVHMGKIGILFWLQGVRGLQGVLKLQGLRKSIRFFVSVLLVLLLSTLNMGSITDGLYFSEKSDLYFNKFQNRFDNLIFNFDHYIQQSVDNSLSPGAAVAIVYRGSILLLKGYGVKETGTDEKIDTHTIFRLGSVSKGFASVLSGIMVREGYLNWDDCLLNHIPDFRLRDTSYVSQLSIRHILSHTSGFPVHAYTDMLDAGIPYEKIKELLNGISIHYRPGAVYAYQNVIYSLISDVLQQVSGKTYNELLREKIFSPLNMMYASSDYTAMVQNNNTALPHLSTKSGWKSRPLNDRYYSVAPASGINASASDMAQWLLALTGNFPDIIAHQILEEVTEINIHTPLLQTYRSTWNGLQNTSYGLGWRIFRFMDHDIVYHGGYVEGFRTEVAFDPVEEMGIAVLFNANTSFASSCIPLFYEMLFKEETDHRETSPDVRLLQAIQTDQ
ncbi:MAG: beta-lactamase family protein [Bacteroidales bacterium]|nr:beta-lactamase family protein [Bacteroidales bacterium]